MRSGCAWRNGVSSREGHPWHASANRQFHRSYPRSRSIASPIRAKPSQAPPVNAASAAGANRPRPPALNAAGSSLSAPSAPDLSGCAACYTDLAWTCASAPSERAPPAGHRERIGRERSSSMPEPAAPSPSRGGHRPSLTPAPSDVVVLRGRRPAAAVGPLLQRPGPAEPRPAPTTISVDILVSTRPRRSLTLGMPAGATEDHGTARLRGLGD